MSARKKKLSMEDVPIVRRYSYNGNVIRSTLEPRFFKNYICDSSRSSDNDVWYTPPQSPNNSNNINGDEIWYTPPQSRGNLELNGKGLVIVKFMRPAVSSSDGVSIEVEDTNTIPEEEAVCRFCFHQLFPLDNNPNNNNNVMKATCRCPFTLTHQHCEIEWYGKKGNNNNNNKCDVCNQAIHFAPVTLSRAPLMTNYKDKHKKVSTLKRFCCCLCRQG